MVFCVIFTLPQKEKEIVFAIQKIAGKN